MKDNKVLSLLSMCRKAGKMEMGFDPTIESLNKGEVKLILFANDLSPKSEKGIRFIAEQKNVEMLTTPLSMDEMGFTIGKRSGILAINDKGFANNIKKQLLNPPTLVKD